MNAFPYCLGEKLPKVAQGVSPNVQNETFFSSLRHEMANIRLSSVLALTNGNKNSKFAPVSMAEQ